MTDEWEHTIQTLVSSFEIAAQDTTGQIDLSYEATFDLRSTGLTLQWLSEMFRNHLAAIDVPEERDVAMKADFDTADTDQVTIHLLSTFRSAARGTARQVGDTPAAATPLVEHQDGAGGLTQSDTVEVHTATGTLNYKLPLSLSQDTLSSMEVSEVLSPRQAEPSPGQQPQTGTSTSRTSGGKPVPLSTVPVRSASQADTPAGRTRPPRPRMRPRPVGHARLVVHRQRLICGERPVDRLTHGRLTEHDIDLMLEAEQLGMD